MASLYKKPVHITDPKTGRKVKTDSKKWWGRYVDADGVERRVPLAVDKKIAQRMLNELVEQAEQGLNGDSIVEATKLPIELHLEAFEEHLIAKNNTPLHIKQRSCKKITFTNAQKYGKISFLEVLHGRNYSKEISCPSM